MSVAQYKDLGKSSSDLLSKGFPTAFEAKLTAESADKSRTLESKLVVSGNAVKASVVPKAKLREHGVEVQATATNSKELKLDVSVADKGVKGLKLKLKTAAPQFDSRDKLAVAVEAEYKQDKVAASAAFDLLNPKGMALTGSAVFAATAGVSFGIDAAYPIAPPAAAAGGSDKGAAASTTTDGAGGAALGPLTRFGVAVDVTTDEGAGKLTVYRNACAKGGVTYGAKQYRRVHSSLAFASQLEWKQASESVPSVLFGVDYALDRDTTLKSKFGSNGHVGLSYATRLSSFSKLTLGLDVNATQTSEHSVGASIELDGSRF